MVTFLVFLEIQDSLNHPSISRMPISPEVAISIRISILNVSDNHIDKNLLYVCVKSDGNVFESKPDLKNIAKIIGKTEPTKTGGSHFSWENKNL